MRIVEFRQKYVFEILFWLLEEEKLMITEIIKKIRQQTAYRAITVLLSLELIEIERGDFNTKFYVLTEKGNTTINKLKEIEAILQD